MKKVNNHQYQHTILISLDSLRGDCISAVSGLSSRFTPRQKSVTPNLDMIIKRGTYFSNCISAAPYTSASHAAYFTGCWPRRNGVFEFFNRRIGRPTIFELAHRANVHTIFQTDFPIILGDSLGFTRGVDTYVVESEQTAFADLIKHQNKQTLSFFHFGGIHYPYGFHKIKFARTDYQKKVTELERIFHIDRSVDYPDMLDESYRDSKDTNLLLRYKTIIDTLWERGEYDYLDHLYREGIEYFMHHRFNNFIKKIIDFVDRTNTLLIIFADHGEHWSSDSRGHSNSISDAVLRVPLICYGTNVARNTVVHDLVRTIDVAPTICQHSAITGVDFDGKSINLSHPDESLGSRQAFAQVWRVGDKQKVHQHQRYILKGKKMIKPLATKLEKETVYSGTAALVREYTGSGSISREMLLKNTGQRLVETKQMSHTIRALRGVLKKYNSITHSSPAISKIRASIADDLKALGYHV